MLTNEDGAKLEECQFEIPIEPFLNGLLDLRQQILLWGPSNSGRKEFAHNVFNLGSGGTGNLPTETFITDYHVRSTLLVNTWDWNTPERGEEEYPIDIWGFFLSGCLTSDYNPCATDFWSLESDENRKITTTFFFLTPELLDNADVLSFMKIVFATIVHNRHTSPIVLVVSQYLNDPYAADKCGAAELTQKVVNSMGISAESVCVLSTGGSGGHGVLSWSAKRALAVALQVGSFHD